jgi:osmoprotectant transport system permease protein
MPLIFAGIRTATVYVVATATLATFAGGGGLGDIVVNEPSYGTGGVIAGSLTITVLTFAIDGLLALVQYGVTPLPLRTAGLRSRSESVVTAGAKSPNPGAI